MACRHFASVQIEKASLVRSPFGSPRQLSTYDTNLVLSLLFSGGAGAVCAGGAHNYCILFILKESHQRIEENVER